MSEGEGGGGGGGRFGEKRATAARAADRWAAGQGDGVLPLRDALVAVLARS